MLIGGEEFTDNTKIYYTKCDQSEYQQDVIIHRSFGKNYQETTGGLNIWHVYISENCKTDYGDIRFTDTSGSQLSYYLWPEYDDSSAKFCVKLTNADQRGILNIWYGNENTISNSNENTVYLLYDNFDGVANDPPDPTKWESIKKGSSSATVKLDGNGNLLLAGSSNVVSSGNIWAKSLLSRNVIIEYRDKVSDQHYADTSYGRGDVGDVLNIESNSWWHTALYLSYVTFVQDTNYIAIKRVGSTEDSDVDLTSTSVPIYPALNTFYIHRFELGSEKINFYRDSTVIMSTSDSTYEDDDFRLLLSQGEYNDGRGGIRTIDYVLVRTYSSTPPSMIGPLIGCVAYWDFRDGSLLDVINNEIITNVNTSVTNDHLNYTNCAFEFESGDSMIWNDIGTISTKISIENTGSGWVVNTDPIYINSTGVSGFVGKLALILLFNRVLSPEELSELSKMLSYKYIYPIPRMERK